MGACPLRACFSLHSTEYVVGQPVRMYGLSSGIIVTSCLNLCNFPRPSGLQRHRHMSIHVPQCIQIQSEPTMTASTKRLCRCFRCFMLANVPAVVVSRPTAAAATSITCRGCRRSISILLHAFDLEQLNQLSFRLVLAFGLVVHPIPCHSAAPAQCRPMIFLEFS